MKNNAVVFHVLVKVDSRVVVAEVEPGTLMGTWLESFSLIVLTYLIPCSGNKDREVVILVFSSFIGQV